MICLLLVFRLVLLNSCENWRLSGSWCRLSDGLGWLGSCRQFSVFTRLRAGDNHRNLNRVFSLGMFRASDKV